MRSSPERARTQLTRAQIARIGEQLRALGVAASPPAAGPPVTDIDGAADALGVERSAIVRGLAGLARLPFVDLRATSPTPAAVALVPENLARRYRCLPLYVTGAELTIGFDQATDWKRLDELASRLPHLKLVPVLVDEAEIGTQLDAQYRSIGGNTLERFLLDPGDPHAAARPSLEVGDHPPTVAIVDAILSRAVECGASDVHLEPFDDYCRVRFRVDGHMRPLFTYARGLHEAIVSRLKVMADLDIVNRLHPQDGRLTIHSDARSTDARISTLRASDGEKVVLRLLGGSLAALRPLDELGLGPEQLATLRAMLRHPHGLILVSGPTGSGKSSTLYAAMAALNDSNRNLVSLEDPVEIRMAGINQVPVRPEHDLTFASALRSVLRQDPDVVMVGEIRDCETAEIALRGALTGHLLLSTVHANDAVETIARLLEMGVPNGILSPALLGVVAQRLVRRLCSCHQFMPPPPGRLAELGLGFLGPSATLPAPVGCEACDGHGYRGRMALFEVLPATTDLKRLIAEGASTPVLAKAARATGLRPMAWSAVRAVVSGLTTLDELERVVPRSIGREEMRPWPGS